MTATGKKAAEFEGDNSTLEGDPRWNAAERAVRSSELSRATHLRAILLFIVRQAILMPEEPIHEFDIAYRVLGRRSDFNPLDDNIVRVQMGHLRRKLENYFSTEGKHEDVIISIALGSYKPVFSNRSELAAEPEAAHKEQRPATVEIAAVAQEHAAADTHPEAHPPHGQRRWMFAAVAAIALLAGCSIALWVQNMALQKSIDTTQRSLYGWRYNPTVLGFWSEFLDTAPDTDVVTADASFSLVQVLSRKAFTFNDYLSHSYIPQLQAAGVSPDMHAALNLISTWNLGSKSSFYMAQRILALDPSGKKVHIYYARDYMPSLIRRDNVILLGSPIANPWVQLFAGSLNFTEKFDIHDPAAPISIANRTPAAGEKPIYTPSGSDEYCAVAYLPNPEHSGKVLLIVGTDSGATEAVGDFLLSEEQMSNFEKMLHVTKLPYFEVLLKTSEVRGTPLTATVEAYRTYPNLH